jgi:PAS domain S-box-containing protein
MSRDDIDLLQVLHLEDDPSEAELIRNILEGEGFKSHVHLISSAREYKKAIENKKFDLIISDYTLPSFNGLDALAIAQEIAPDTPFIFVSGTMVEDAGIQALVNGATDYVLKTKLSRLAPAVRRAMKESDDNRKLKLAEKMREMMLEDLKTSEARFRGLLEGAPDGVVIVGGENKIIFVNTVTEKLFGFEHDELIGKPLDTLVPDRFKGAHESHLKAFNLHPHSRAVNSGLGLFGRKKDGSEFPADIMLSPLSTDREVAVLAMIRDITEMKKAEESLRLSEERYRALVDGARDAIFSLSQNAVINSLNPAFETITGWKRDQWIGKSITELIHPDDRENALETFHGVIQGAVVGVNEYRIVKKSGDYLIGEFNTTAQFKDGKPVGLLGIARDVTAQRALEDQLRQSQKLESLGTLAGGIAHDFNNILGIITGYVGLLRKSIPENDKKLTTFADSIGSAAERAIGLVRQLLMFARKHERSLDYVNVNDIATEVYKLTSETFPKQITISIETAKDLTVVYADRSEIHQLLLNLCVNARDAMMDNDEKNMTGGILKIGTSFVKGEDLKKKFPAAEWEEYVELSVSDTGIGMDEETQEKIFEPFFTTKAEGKGTGLGLSMVHGVVMGNGGMIDVDSKKGSGTAFRVYLPARPPDGVPNDTTQEEMQSLQGGSETIMLAEDEPGLREFVEDILTTAGYKVIAAEDGQRAIALFLDYRNVGLVLSDIGLPKIGGIELVESIQRMNPVTKVIIASGFIDENTRLELRERGVKEFIQKPYKRDELLRKVRDVLDGR